MAGPWQLVNAGRIHRLPGGAFLRVSERGLPGAAEQKLAQLAMAIEIHCRQRFSTCRGVLEIAAMLIAAGTCGIELVRRRKREFMDSLPVLDEALGVRCGHRAVRVCRGRVIED